MHLIAEESIFSSSDVILAIVLLLGFVISVMVGIWIFATRWREHKTDVATKDDDRGMPT